MYLLCEEIQTNDNGVIIFCINNPGQFGSDSMLGAGTDGNIYIGIPGHMTIEYRNVFDPADFFTDDFMQGNLSSRKYNNIAKKIFQKYVELI